MTRERISEVWSAISGTLPVSGKCCQRVPHTVLLLVMCR